MKLSASEVFFGVIAVFVAKMLALGLTISDALALFVILAGLIGRSISDYLYPKRPDLFREMLEIKKSIDDVRAKSDEHERDLTALKFGAARR